MTNFTFSKNFKGIAEAFLTKPSYYRPLLELLDNVMVAPSELSKIEREVIAAHVSAINDCHFCVEAHRETLKSLNADPALVETLENSVENIEGISERTRQLLKFASKITRKPHDVSEADIRKLKEHGLDENTIEHAANVAGIFNYVNRLVDVFGVEGDKDYFKAVGKSLAANGYAKLLK